MKYKTLLILLMFFFIVAIFIYDKSEICEKQTIGGVIEIGDICRNEI